MEARRLVAAHRSDADLGQPQGACLAEHRAELGRVESDARLVFVPRAEPRVLAHSAQLRLEQPGQRLPAAPPQERRVVLALWPELSDELVPPVWELRLLELLPVSRPAERHLPEPAVLLPDAQGLPLEQRRERVLVSMEALQALAQQAEPPERHVPAQVRRVSREVQPDVQASPWPLPWQLLPRPLAQPARGNACARVRRARDQASSSASSFP